MSKNSASVLAITAMAGAMLASAPVLAQSLQGWKVSVEGGIANGNFADETSNVPGAAIALPDNDPWGGFGSVSIGRSIDENMDWRISAAFLHFDEEERSQSATTGTFPFAFDSSQSERDDLDIYTLDLDIGRTWSSGQFEGRGFAGIRGAHARSSSSYAYSAEEKIGFPGPIVTTTEEASEKSRFTGAGPLVGGEFYYGSIVGIAGSASGAVMLGHRDIDAFSSVDSDLGDSSKTDWIANLQASLGVAARPSAQTQVTLGYRVDSWFNVRSDASEELDRDRDVVSHGPFIRAQYRF